MKASEWTGGTPGSDEARANGCKCPTMDNCRGRGRYADGEKFGWWVSEKCALHARDHERAASEGGET